MSHSLKQIHFIVNPIAGSGQHILTEAFLKASFNSADSTITVKFTEYKKHAQILAKASVKEQAHIIVACGGDGTINEVASCLVNSSIVLGIIPIGSGNGLASHIGISKNVQKAINTIKGQHVQKIDVGKIHKWYFFSNAGIGFDADVIENYEASESRKLKSYIKAVLNALKTLKDQNKLGVTVNGQASIINPFMMFISNSNELGYRVSLTPKASLHDGLLDVLIISKISRLKAILLGVLVLIKKHHILKEVQSFQTERVLLKRLSGASCHAQIDGELYDITQENITVSILKEALRVIV